MTHVAVTGGSGKLGRACVADLLAHGYQVLNIDCVPPAKELCPTILTDLADFGQTMNALATPIAVSGGKRSQFDAIVHLAAIPAPDRFTNCETFRVNTLSTYHVFEAARVLGIKNVVWASSETMQGMPFDSPPPYVPLDEEYAPRPESAYALTKLLGEEMAKQFCRWDPALKIIGLRFSNVMEPHDYQMFPGFEADAKIRKGNLWSYIDARDASQAIRKALEIDLKGAAAFIIANEETVMSRPNEHLLAEVYPSVPLKRPIAPNEVLLSIEKARRILGYRPEYSWRKELENG